MLKITYAMQDHLSKPLKRSPLNSMKHLDSGSPRHSSFDRTNQEFSVKLSTGQEESHFKILSFSHFISTHSENQREILSENMNVLTPPQRSVPETL